MNRDREQNHVPGLNLGALAALTLLLTGCGSYHHSGMSTSATGGYDAYGMTAEQDGNAAANAEQWGIRVLGIRTTADGYMLDFRYRVLDAEKAAPLLDRRIKPYLLVGKSEARLAVPVSAKIGAMRQTTRNVKEGRNYFMMFGNPSRHVQPGDQVTIVIGDFSTGDLTVM